MNWRVLLTQLRTEAGVSQRRLSKLSGVNRSMIRRFEAGTSVPDITKLERILAALGYELDVLPALRLPTQQDHDHGQAEPGRSALH